MYGSLINFTEQRLVQQPRKAVLTVKNTNKVLIIRPSNAINYTF